jgi:protoporphyrinogen oxidase
MKDIAILGAGFGGMSAAFDLVRAGNNVTIYEAADYVGGLASGFKASHWDWTVEKYYHHWFASDRHMLALFDELGWREGVIYKRPYTVMYHRGKYYPFDSILQALIYPGLGYGINKIRFGLLGLYLRLTDNWRPFEKVTVDGWMRRWAGDSVYEKMWEPLVIGKFGERHARQVNMAWMWARFKARTTHLGTYQGGFQAFADQLADHLGKLGVRLLLNMPVQRILLSESGKLTLESSTGTMVHDQCLVTTSPRLLAQIAPSLPPDYLKGLLDLKSMGAVVLVLSLKNQLSEQGYYWYNIPKSAGYPFLALVEHTNFVPAEHFAGEHIIYCGDYLEPDHEHFQLSHDELLARFLPALERFNPKFEQDWVINSWLHRTHYAQPVPLLNHSRNIPDITTPISGLYFASMSQVYPWDRGTNFAVEIGRRAARIMMGTEGSRS